MKMSEIIDKACIVSNNTNNNVKVRNVLVSDGRITSMRTNVMYHTDFISNLISGMLKSHKDNSTESIIGKVMLGMDKCVDIEMNANMLNVSVSVDGSINNICYPLKRVGPTFYSASLKSVLRGFVM